jgi:hypothetical protein
VGFAMVPSAARGTHAWGFCRSPVLLERPLPVTMGTNPAVSDGRLARPLSAAGPERERARPTSGMHEPRTPLEESPGDHARQLDQIRPNLSAEL